MKTDLTKEVQELVDNGQLHIYDSEWIARLRPESQAAAAFKCLGGLVPLAMHGDWRITDKRYGSPMKDFKNKNKERA